MWSKLTVNHVLRGLSESNGCKCGKLFKSLLECSQTLNETKIVEGHCLTYSNTTEHFGSCPYNTNSFGINLTVVPSDITQLDEKMCAPLNCTGLLCSQCQPGLGPAVFSNYRECKECIKWPYGWIVYFVRLIVPLTLFCVIVFQINIASPLLNGFVLAAQIVSSTLKNNLFIIDILGESYTATKFVADLYGLFTLDFFVQLIPSFCIKKNMSMHTVIALEYLAALYPILFTIMFYVCISLHDKGCRLIVICWKPFHKCFAKFR